MSAQPAIQLSPEFRLTQPLPEAGADIFEAAKALADLALADSFELVEQQFTHGDVPFDPEAVPTGFTLAIPNTLITSFDITRIPATRYAASKIMLHMRDAQDPERQIHLTELDARGTIPGDFAIYDSRPSYTRPTKLSMQRELVHQLLELQLWSPSSPPKAHRMDLSVICQNLGDRARAFRRERKVGVAGLPGSLTFHAQRDITYIPTDITDTGVISTYSTWLTGDVPESRIKGVNNLSVRTIANFNGNNLDDPHNTMSYEVTADEMNEASARALGRRHRLTPEKRGEVITAFLEYVTDCATKLRGQV